MITKDGNMLTLVNRSKNKLQNFKTTTKKSTPPPNATPPKVQGTFRPTPPNPGLSFLVPSTQLSRKWRNTAGSKDPEQ